MKDSGFFLYVEKKRCFKYLFIYRNVDPLAEFLNIVREIQSDIEKEMFTACMFVPVQYQIKGRYNFTQLC